MIYDYFLCIFRSSGLPFKLVICAFFCVSPIAPILGEPSPVSSGQMLGHGLVFLGPDLVFYLTGIIINDPKTTKIIAYAMSSKSDLSSSSTRSKPACRGGSGQAEGQDLQPSTSSSQSNSIWFFNSRLLTKLCPSPPSEVDTTLIWLFGWFITFFHWIFSFCILAGSNSLSPARTSNGQVMSFSCPINVNSCKASSHSATVALAYPNLVRKSP